MRQHGLALLVLVLVAGGGFWLDARLDRIESYIDGDRPGLNLVQWTQQLFGEFWAAADARCDIVASVRNDIILDPATIGDCNTGDPMWPYMDFPPYR